MSIDNERHYEYQQAKYCYQHDIPDEDFYVIGDRVYIDGFRPASVAYFGETEFGSGDWLGVVLDQPTGCHDGKLHGRSYFQCAPNHGLFVRPSRATKMSRQSHKQQASSISGASSRSTSRCSKSPAGDSSIMDSYFYDEDYRVPRVDSLASKLFGNSIHRSIPYSSSDNNLQAGRKGILKHNQGTKSPVTEDSDWFTTKTRELSERISKITMTTGEESSRSPVFEFRPARCVEPPIAPGRSSSLGRDYHDSSTSICRGDRVAFKLDGRNLQGIVRYLGETDFASGEWAGVELDWPEGNCNGSLMGQRYFVCRNNYGVFVPAKRLTKYRDYHDKSKTLDSKSVRSTITSPPPGADIFDSFIRGSPSVSLTSRSPSSSGVKSSSSAGDYMDTCAHYFGGDRPDSPWTGCEYYGPKGYDAYGGSPKFTESDIERELEKSLNQRPKPEPNKVKVTGSNIEKVKPVAVKYTFTSTKYGGNPIAWRSVAYD